MIPKPQLNEALDGGYLDLISFITFHPLKLKKNLFLVLYDKNTTECKNEISIKEVRL